MRRHVSNVAYGGLPSLLMAVMTAWTTSAVAQPVQSELTADDAKRVTARELGVKGIEAFWAKDYIQAEADLDQAFRLFATPVLALWSARARMQLGRLVESAERYSDAGKISAAVGEQAAQEEAQRDAANELNALLPRIPKLTLQLAGAELREVVFMLNGVQVPGDLVALGTPRPLNPGAYRVEATRGAERYVAQVQLGEAESKVVPFRFEAPAAKAVPPTAAGDTAAVPPAAAHPVTSAVSGAFAPETDVHGTPATEPGASEKELLVTGGIAGLSIGAIGIVVSAITASAAGNVCGGGHCRSTSKLDEYGTLRATSIVGFWAGLALVTAGGVSLIVANPPSPSDAGVSWGLGPGAVMVRKVF